MPLCRAESWSGRADTAKHSRQVKEAGSIKRGVDTLHVTEYQEKAQRTSPPGHDKALNGCMGLMGECGELVDAVKKWKFQSGDHAQLPLDKLVDECGDILWYCAEVFSGFDKVLSEAYERETRVEEMSKQRIAYDLETACALIAQQSVHPYFLLTHSGLGYKPSAIEINHGLWHVMMVFLRVEDVLKRFLSSSLDAAMSRNIDKLYKRYPDGFDPERSLHRAADDH